MAEMEKQIVDMGKKMDEMDVLIAKKDARIAELEAYLAKAKEHAEKISARLEEMGKQIAEKDVLLARLEKDVALKKKENAEKDEQISTYLWEIDCLKAAAEDREEIHKMEMLLAEKDDQLTKQKEEIDSLGCKMSTLPDPTMEYEQHTPPIEPTLELFPSHELPETTSVTEVGFEQKESISKEEAKQTVKLEPEEEMEELAIEEKEAEQQEVTKGEHLIEREETTKDVTTTDYEISTLPDPTMEYEQHTPLIEPTLELFPSHELPETPLVTDVGPEQKESISKEETKQMEKLEPEEEMEELAIEEKETEQQEVTKGEHLIEREETTKDVTTTSTGYEISTLPDPTMEYEQHTPLIEPTLELSPSHELPETPLVTDVGPEQKESISKEETKQMEKLEPEEEMEELAIEEKEAEQQEVTKGEHLIEREGELGKLLTGVDAERGEERARPVLHLSIPKHELASLEDQEEHIAKKHEQLAEGDLKKEVAMKEKQLAEKHDQLAKSNEVAATLAKQISQKEEQLAEKDDLLTKRDDEIIKLAEAAKRLNKRNTTTSEQRAALLEAYINVPKPSKEKREELAAETGLDIKYINNWFSNRRSTDKKDANLKSSIAEMTKQIIEMDKQITEKDMLLARREKDIAKQDDQISQYSQEITSLKAKVESLRRDSPDSHDKAVQTEKEMIKDVMTNYYLRGMEVIASTTFHLTGSSQTHVWEGHGLKLHIPDGALPPDHTGCTLDVRAGLSGQFEFSDGSHPVSAMYWLSCKERFLVPATLELQHCAIVRDATQCSRLRFAIAECSQPELPYTFKSLDRGVFTLNSSYGSISLSQFSIESIVAITERISQDDPQQPLQHVYCAKLFYHQQLFSQHWQLDFTITQDLQLCHRHVDDIYTAPSTKRAPHFEVHFEEDQISLDIPDRVVEEGWKLVPLTPPLITKEQVDNFKTGRQIPTCQLKVVCTQKENPVDLDYKLNLLGARKPYNVMYFSISPGGRAATGEKRRLQHDDTEQENGQVKRRRDDSGEQESSVSAEVPEPILKDLLKVQAGDWYALGLNLDVSEHELNSIEKDNRCDVKTCRRFMFREWLKHTDATYQQLVEALEAIGEEAEAARLCKKYGLNSKVRCPPNSSVQ